MTLDELIKTARDIKGRRASSPNHRALCPHLYVERGGEVVAMIETRDVDKMQALRAAQLARGGFSADEINVVLDAHMGGEKPDGTRWQPGEMQRRCDEEGLCETGLITDALSLFHVTPDDLQFASLPYHYHTGGDPLRWVDRITRSDRDDMKVSGFIADSLRKVMRLKDGFPTMLEFAPKFGVNTEKQARAHADMATARLLGELGCQVALVCMTEEHAEAARVAKLSAPELVIEKLNFTGGKR